MPKPWITLAVIMSLALFSCSKKGETAKVGTFDDLADLPKPALIPFREGHWNTKTLEKEDRWGLADANDPNKIVVQPQFTEILYVPEEDVYICKKVSKEDKKEDKKVKRQYILYDKKGKELALVNEYFPDPDVYNFRDGMLIFKQESESEDKYGIMNTDGKDIVSPQYDRLALLGQGLAAAKVKDKWTLLSLKGGKVKELFHPRFSEMELYISEDLIVVKEGDVFGFINTKGEVVINPQYKEALPFSEGLAPVKIGEKWGYIDKKGKEVIRPDYEIADLFVNGYARVRKDGHWGFINKKGDFIVSPRYDDAGTFIDGIAPVKQSNKWGCINEEGELIIPASYEFLIRYPKLKVIAVRKDGKWGFLDYKGKALVTPRYEDFNGFGENGLAAVQIGKAWGYVDKEGNVVIPAKYKEAYPFMPCTDMAVVYDENGKLNYINEKGEVLLKEGATDIENISSYKSEPKFLSSFSLNERMINEIMVKERSHPLLMHPIFRPYYAYEVYHSLFCFSGTDVVSMKNGARGHINLKGMTFWRDEKPPYPEVVGTWSGKGELTFYDREGSEKTLKIEGVDLSVQSPYRSEDDKIRTRVSLSGRNLGYNTFTLELQGEKFISAEDMSYDMQSLARSLISFYASGENYYIIDHNIEKMEIRLTSVSSNEVELRIEMRNVRIETYEEGYRGEKVYPKVVFKATLKSGALEKEESSSPAEPD